MPMLYLPKLIRSDELESEPAPHSAPLRQAACNRPQRLYEIEFFRADRDELDDLLGSCEAAPGALEHPAQPSGAAALPRDPRLARAIEAAAKGWVIERY